MTMAEPTLAPEKIEDQISPEYVRISIAAAMELGLKPGRFLRGNCGCINLLQAYPQGCFANCSYCGLARERPGLAVENSFIRVDWPLYPTVLVAESIGQRDARAEVGRVCLAQVQDQRSNRDLLEMTAMVRSQAPDVPISALALATLLDRDMLMDIKDAGADIIGIGMDAATEELFIKHRGRGARGPHKWDQHWEIARLARELYGPYKVNLHIIIGLGETDRELVDMFTDCHSQQIACYLFSFNPEPGTVLADQPRTRLDRHRRIQLVKHLIETERLSREALRFDAQGSLMGLDAPGGLVAAAVTSGLPFMTDGCPDRHGVMACNRPCGSYRPGEEYRDYPFQPDENDVLDVQNQMRLHEIWSRQGVPPAE